MWFRQELVCGMLIYSTAVIGVLVTISSCLGIFVSNIYSRETFDWALQARAQDIVNVLAVIVLLTAAYFMRKKSLRGFLVWTGTLLFLIYAYVIYSFASHFDSLFLVYVVTLGLLVYAFLGVVHGVDFQKIKDSAQLGTTTMRAVSTYLILAAIIFYFLWLSEDVSALLNGTVPSSISQEGLLVNPIHVLDIGLYLPALIITSISLWRNGALGHALSLPLLVFSALTGLGILAIDFLTAENGNAVKAGQVVFVTILVLASVILSWLYLRRIRIIKIGVANQE